MPKKEFFSMQAHKVANVIGSYWALLFATSIVALWLIAGLFMRFSSEWQSIISAVTGIITLFMVIFIQHTQNHATKTLQLKLDELIRATERARNKLVELEQMTDRELDVLQDEFVHIRDKAVEKEALAAAQPPAGS